MINLSDFYNKPPTFTKKELETNISILLNLLERMEVDENKFHFTKMEITAIRCAICLAYKQIEEYEECEEYEMYG